jgi:hypothetical protein
VSIDASLCFGVWCFLCFCLFFFLFQPWHCSLPPFPTPFFPPSSHGPQGQRASPYQLYPKNTTPPFYITSLSIIHKTYFRVPRTSGRKLVISLPQWPNWIF